MKRIAIPVLGLSLLPAAAMAEGMPQLDFGNPLTVSQVVWGAIIFIVLYLMLSRTGLPLVASVLDERASKIAHELESAREAKLRADSGMKDAQEATAKARAEAQASLNAAVNAAKQAAAEQSETLNARLDKQLKDSEAQIAQARASAMSSLRQVATETASIVVSRLTGTAADPGAVDQAIGSVMARRGLA